MVNERFNLFDWSSNSQKLHILLCACSLISQWACDLISIWCDEMRMWRIDNWKEFVHKISPQKKLAKSQYMLGDLFIDELSHKRWPDYQTFLLSYWWVLQWFNIVRKNSTFIPYFWTVWLRLLIVHVVVVLYFSHFNRARNAYTKCCVTAEQIYERKQEQMWNVRKFYSEINVNSAKKWPLICTCLM